MKRPRVYVGLSGGVDSATAAALLKKRGFDVVGVFLKNWSDDTFADCPWEKDLAWARTAAQHLGIPLVTWNFERQYRAKVLDYFFAEYAAGRTPNPDIVCNKEIKFGLFLQRALKEGADFVATGHYARIVRRGGRPWLAQPRDKHKDQTYFLYSVDPGLLDRILFPLANLTKPAVRRLATKLGLPNAERPDSQGICFVGEINLVRLLESRLPQKTGEIRDVDDRPLGRHRGAWFYTIGQRHGLGIGGGIPYYVVDKDIFSNTVIVAAGDHPSLYSRAMTVENLVWQGLKSRRIMVRLRHGGQLVPATVKLLKDKTAFVHFGQEQRAVTPGQAAVFYQKGLVVGGGTISRSITKFLRKHDAVEPAVHGANADLTVVGKKNILPMGRRVH